MVLYLEMYAAATVIQRRIKSVFPPINGKTDRVYKLLNTVVEPRSFLHLKYPDVSIMWSRYQYAGLDDRIWTPSHFVPLVHTLRASTPSAVDDDSAPSAVDDDSAPSAVDDDSTPSAVDDYSASSAVDDDSAPSAVDDDSTPFTVDDDSTPSAVDDYSAPSAVDDDSTPTQPTVELIKTSRGGQKL